MATHSSILAWKIPWTEEPGMEGYSPWGHKKSDTTEQLHFTSMECKHRKQTYGPGGGCREEGQCGTNGDSNVETCALLCNTDSQCECAE